MIFLHIDYVIMYYDYRLLFVCYIYVRLIAVLKFLLHFVVRKRTVSFVKTSIEKFRAETAGNLKKSSF